MTRSKSAGSPKDCGVCEVATSTAVQTPARTVTLGSASATFTAHSLSCVRLRLPQQSPASHRRSFLMLFARTFFLGYEDTAQTSLDDKAQLVVLLEATNFHCAASASYTDQTDQATIQTSKSAKTCQLCYIRTITNNGRWPNPLTSAVKDVCFLTKICHDEHAAWQANSRGPSKLTKSDESKRPKKNASAPKHLLENACPLATAVKDLEEQCQDWWASKTVMIRKLQDSCEDGDAKKVTELHKSTMQLSARSRASRLGSVVL